MPLDLQSSACKVSMGNIPLGTTSTARAITLLGDVFPCGAPVVYIGLYRKFDILFANNNVSWHTGVNVPPLDWSNELDLETVALHELGHFQLLQHNNAEEDVMYFKSWKYKRTLRPNDLEGGLFLMGLNTLLDGCGGPMVGVSENCVLNSEDLSPLVGIKSYPNPTDNLITIDLGAEVSKKLVVKISSIVGVEIYFEVLKTRKTSIDVSNFPNGSYLLSVVDDAGSIISYKLIKL